MTGDLVYLKWEVNSGLQDGSPVCLSVPLIIVINGFTLQAHYNLVCFSLPPMANIGIWMRQQMSIPNELRMKKGCSILTFYAY